MQEKHKDAYARLLRRARQKLGENESRYGQIIEYLKWRMQGRAGVTVYAHEKYFRRSGGFISRTQHRESAPCTFAQFQAVPVRDVETVEYVFD